MSNTSIRGEMNQFDGRGLISGVDITSYINHVCPLFTFVYMVVYEPMQYRIQLKLLLSLFVLFNLSVVFLACDADTSAETEEQAESDEDTTTTSESDDDDPSTNSETDDEDDTRRENEDDKGEDEMTNNPAVGGDDNTGDDNGGDENSTDDQQQASADSGTMGGPCACDTDCESALGNPGLCVYGVCMQLSSNQSCTAGSQDGCAAGSRCWDAVCWPDCDTVSCSGTCDGDGSCVPTEETAAECDHTCSQVCPAPEAPPCESDADCSNGLVCHDSGNCVQEIAPMPNIARPTCDNLPSFECEGGEAYCSELIPFEPIRGPGYWNYPLNGETEADQYRSYARRDLVLLIKYASAFVDCYGADFPGNGGELGLGDMSEANGDIPGTRENQPGHPEGTHVDGHDMDIAYYQTNTANNILRSVCDHVDNGQDQYHCVAPPNTFDVWRTALFFGALHDSPQLRVIGVDGQIGPLVESAFNDLCEAGWLSGSACFQPALAYEVTNQNYGWYYFHHHHFHVSITGSVGGFSMIPTGLPRDFILPPKTLIRPSLPAIDPRASWSL